MFSSLYILTTAINELVILALIHDIEAITFPTTKESLHKC